MTTTIRPTQSAALSRTTLRSVGVVTAAFLIMAIATGIVDHILHWLGVFPPWGQITYEPLPYVFAIVYRALFGVAGAYFAATWAPRAPLRLRPGLVSCIARRAHAAGRVGRRRAERVAVASLEVTTPNWRASCCV